MFLKSRAEFGENTPRRRARSEPVLIKEKKPHRWSRGKREADYTGIPRADRREKDIVTGM
jgi:hypothetical protein